MVRHRTRWLLVKLEFTDEVRNASGESKSLSRKGFNGTSKDDSPCIPSRKDFIALLRKTISLSFGLAAEGASSDVQVRFFDPTSTQLALVRVPRQSCEMVRASMTLLLTRKQLMTLGESEDTEAKSDVIASVISVHGSARTSKLATLRKIRDLYRQKIQVLRRSLQESESTRHLKTEEKKLFLELQERLSIVQEID
jgi:hypothetical protein